TVWTGEVVLEGAGDPTLSSAGLRNRALQVRAAGIRRIVGSIVADESWFDGNRTVAGWKPGFYLNESPPLSALVVNRGRVGRYLSTSPALAAGTAFRSALRTAGIAVTGRVRVGVAADFSVPLASFSSPPLSTIVRFMDRESGNVAAKTGTTNDASALSGFVRNRFAFAVLQNGHPLSYWWARVAQDRFAQVLAAQ